MREGCAGFQLANGSSFAFRRLNRVAKLFRDLAAQTMPPSAPTREQCLIRLEALCNMILGSWLHAIFRPARPSVPVSSRRSDGLCYSATWLDSHGNSVAQQHTIDPTPGGVSTHSSISERHPWPEGPGRCRCPIALAQSKLPPHEHRERHHSQGQLFILFRSLVSETYIDGG